MSIRPLPPDGYDVTCDTCGYAEPFFDIGTVLELVYDLRRMGWKDKRVERSTNPYRGGRYSHQCPTCAGGAPSTQAQSPEPTSQLPPAAHGSTPSCSGT